MSEVNLTLRMADRSRKAEVTVSNELVIGDIVHGAIQNWELPRDTDYTIVNTTSGRTLNPRDTIARAGLSPGDVLEIQPVLTAGGL